VQDSTLPPVVGLRDIAVPCCVMVCGCHFGLMCSWYLGFITYLAIVASSGWLVGSIFVWLVAWLLSGGAWQIRAVFTPKHVDFVVPERPDIRPCEIGNPPGPVLNCFETTVVHNPAGDIAS
jgi:hypothetical protein